MSPTAKSDRPRGSSISLSEVTIPCRPVLTVDQCCPSHAAMPIVFCPPMPPTHPHAYNFGPFPSSQTLSTLIWRMMPVVIPPPTSVHCSPSHLTMP
ncbi:MAG: hypothetical protein JNM80_00055 [Phycisphaerae bacterium]|nr:hypothetical protein [Phycisphaerae bacterium]